MSADMLVECFWEELNDKHRPVRKPNWKKGHKYIDKFCDNMKRQNTIWTEVEHLGGSDCGDMKDLPKISEALHRYLDEVETAYRTYSKELTYLEFMPYRVWITGGMNYGDSPTELYNTLMLLNSISVLEATGLNPTYNPPDRG